MSIHPTRFGRLLFIAAITALFTIMPFVYPTGHERVEADPTATPGTDCTIEYRQGLGFDNWYPVEVCGVMAYVR